MLLQSLRRKPPVES